MKVLDHGFVQLVSKTGHVGLSVTNAARCSYGSTSDDLGEKDRKLIAYLLSHGHTSPFRHAFFTFHVKAPLFVFRQWWKYQVGSTWREYAANAIAEPKPCGRTMGHGLSCVKGYECSDACAGRVPIEVQAADIQIDTDQGCSWNELSGRYKVMEPEFYMPAAARRNSGRQASEDADDESLTKRMQDHMRRAQVSAVKKYEAMLKDGVAKELARLVLPPSIYSECYWTVSLQAVLHFLDQRLKEDAQFEIRQYAQAVLDLIRPDLEEMGVTP